MRVKPLIASVVGNTDETHWGQTFSTPAAYGVMEVHDPAGNARSLGVRNLMKLTQGISTATVSLESLTALAATVYAGPVVSLIVLVPVGNVVYLVSRGKSTVYLKRGNQLSRLTHGDGALSGQVQEQDTLLLATAGFVEALSETELTEVFDHLPPAAIAEKLTLLLHTKPTGMGSAALLFEAQISVAVLAETSAVAMPEIKRPALRISLPLVRRVLGRLRGHIRGWLPSVRSGRRPWVVVSTVVLVLLFLVSVVLGIRKQQAASRSQSVGKTLVAAQYAFDEGVALLSLNPVKGRERLSTAKAMLEPLVKSVPARSSDGRKLATLYGKIMDNLTQAMHVITQEPQLFFDVSLLKKGAQATAMALDGDTLAVLDAPGSTAYAVTVVSKNGQIIAGGAALAASSLVSLHGDSVYILTASGISRVSLREKQTTPDIIKKDSQWGKIARLVAFAGNLYLLDTQKSRVWKYVPSSQADAFELHEYLNPDTLPDFSQATGMAINGSVWVGTTTGKLLRFTQGQENSFQPSGVEPGFGTSLVVYVSDATANVYVLDSANKRVVVMDKDGTYQAQYLWKGAVAPTQLVVSEDAKKILLLADGKIYAIELK